MSVYRKAGLVAKGGGKLYETIQQIKRINFTPVKKVEYRFDPFHSNAKEFRDLVSYLSAPRVRETNVKCVFKTEVASDNSEPTLSCKLENGKTVKILGGNLNCLEILTALNKVILPLVPKEQAVPASIPKTKSQKKKK